MGGVRKAAKVNCAGPWAGQPLCGRARGNAVTRQQVGRHCRAVLGPAGEFGALRRCGGVLSWPSIDGQVGVDGAWRGGAGRGGSEALCIGQVEK